MYRSRSEASQNLESLNSGAEADSESQDDLDEVEVLSSTGCELPDLPPWMMGHQNFSQWALSNLP